MSHEKLIGPRARSGLSQMIPNFPISIRGCCHWSRAMTAGSMKAG